MVEQTQQLHIPFDTQLHTAPTARVSENMTRKKLFFFFFFFFLLGRKGTNFWFVFFGCVGANF